jgi:hypothetical protein
MIGCQLTAALRRFVKFIREILTVAGGLPGPFPRKLQPLAF